MFRIEGQQVVSAFLGGGGVRFPRWMQEDSTLLDDVGVWRSQNFTACEGC